MHLLSRCSALGPGLGPLPRRFASSSRVDLKFKLANAAVCPIRTAFGPLRHCMALRGAEGTPEGGGRTSGGAQKKNRKEEARLKKKFGESTITFLVFRTIPRGFLCVLTTPMRTQFSTLETKMRKKFWEEAPIDRVKIFFLNFFGQKLLTWIFPKS